MMMDLFSGMLLFFGLVAVGYYAFLANKDEAKKAAALSTKEHQA
jgi:hypothetical protein